MIIAHLAVVQIVHARCYPFLAAVQRSDGGAVTVTDDFSLLPQTGGWQLLLSPLFTPSRLGAQCNSQCRHTLYRSTTLTHQTLTSME